MHGLFVPIVVIGLMVHVSVFTVVTMCECHIELQLKGYLLACLIVELLLCHFEISCIPFLPGPTVCNNGRFGPNNKTFTISFSSQLRGYRV